jgi:hypothetical protein
MKTIFFPPKNKRLARIISIETPQAFRRSIRVLKRGGLTTAERRALVLARTRAKAMLKRRNLSARERREMAEIARTRI